ncbi:MAG: hypothetical protein HYT97_08760 [Elusimicrobia bacterium]|nr:hypothetical protein [Elusimicrobiota bacterium]
MAVVFFYVQVGYGVIEPLAQTQKEKKYAKLWQERKEAANKLNSKDHHSQQLLKQESDPTVSLPKQTEGLLSQLPFLETNFLTNSFPQTQEFGRDFPVVSPSELEVGKLSPSQSKTLGSWLKALPPSYASLRDLYIPPNWQPQDLMVFHIQDAHENFEAQKNIARIIELLAEARIDNSGFRVRAPTKSSGNDLNGHQNQRHQLRMVVGLEGASGPMNFEPYQTFPEPGITKEIADYFLKESFISGAEYAGMTLNLNRGFGNRVIKNLQLDSIFEKETFGKLPEPPVLFWGIESKEPYLDHIRAYKDSIPLQQKAKEIHQVLLSSVNQIKATVFNPKLKTLDEKITRYNKGEIKLGDYIKFLFQLQPKVSSHYPNLRQFLDALSLEESLDYEKVEEERRKLTKELTEKLPKIELNNLAAASVSYRLKTITHGSFYQYLKDLCFAYGVGLSQYPDMDKYIRYVLTSEKIVSDHLFDEINLLERKGLESNIRNRDEKKLIQISRDLTLIEKLIKYELSPMEWEEYANRKEEIRKVQERIKEFTKKNIDSIQNKTAEFAHKEIEQKQELLNYIHAFEKFNQAAIKRDGLLVGNLLSKVKETKSGSTLIGIMVTGGFHTAGITRLLKDKKTAYVVLSPRIGEVKGSGSEYLDVFTRDKTQLEKLFTGERITLKSPLPTALYQAGEEIPTQTYVVERMFTLFASGRLVKKALQQFSHLTRENKKQVEKDLLSWMESIKKEKGFTTIDGITIKKIEEFRKSDGTIEKLTVRISLYGNVNGERKESKVALEIRTEWSAPAKDDSKGTEGFKVPTKEQNRQNLANKISELKFENEIFTIYVPQSDFIERALDAIKNQLGLVSKIVKKNADRKIFLQLPNIPMKIIPHITKIAAILLGIKIVTLAAPAFAAGTGADIVTSVANLFLNVSVTFAFIMLSIPLIFMPILDQLKEQELDQKMFSSWKQRIRTLEERLPKEESVLLSVMMLAGTLIFFYFISYINNVQLPLFNPELVDPYLIEYNFSLFEKFVGTFASENQINFYFFRYKALQMFTGLFYLFLGASIVNATINLTHAVSYWIERIHYKLFAQEIAAKNDPIARKLRLTKVPINPPKRSRERRIPLRNTVWLQSGGYTIKCWVAKTGENEQVFYRQYDAMSGNPLSDSKAVIFQGTNYPPTFTVVPHIENLGIFNGDYDTHLKHFKISMEHLKSGSFAFKLYDYESGVTVVQDRKIEKESTVTEIKKEVSNVIIETNDPLKSQEDGEEEIKRILQSGEIPLDQIWSAIGDGDSFGDTNKVDSKDLIGTLGKPDSTRVLFSNRTHRSIYKELRIVMQEKAQEDGGVVYRYVGGDEFMPVFTGTREEVKEKLDGLVKHVNEYFKGKYAIFRISGDNLSKQQINSLKRMKGSLVLARHGKGYNILFERNGEIESNLEALFKGREGIEVAPIDIETELRGLITISIGAVSAEQVLEYIVSQSAKEKVRKEEKKMRAQGSTNDQIHAMEKRIKQEIRMEWITIKNGQEVIQQEKLDEFYLWSIRIANDMLKKAKEEDEKRVKGKGRNRAELPTTLKENITDYLEKIHKPITPAKIQELQEKLKKHKDQEGNKGDGLDGLTGAELYEVFRGKVSKSDYGNLMLVAMLNWGLGQKRAFHELQDIVGYLSGNEAIKLLFDQIQSTLQEIENLQGIKEGEEFYLSRGPPDKAYTYSTNVSLRGPPELFERLKFLVKELEEKLNEKFKKELEELKEQENFKEKFPDFDQLRIQLVIYDVSLDELKKLKERSPELAKRLQNGFQAIDLMGGLVDSASVIGMDRIKEVLDVREIKIEGYKDILVLGLPYKDGNLDLRRIEKLLELYEEAEQKIAEEAYENLLVSRGIDPKSRVNPFKGKRAIEVATKPETKKEEVSKGIIKRTIDLVVKEEGTSMVEYGILTSLAALGAIVLSLFVPLITPMVVALTTILGYPITTKDEKVGRNKKGRYWSKDKEGEIPIGAKVGIKENFQEQLKKKVPFHILPEIEKLDLNELNEIEKALRLELDNDQVKQMLRAIHLLTYAELFEGDFKEKDEPIGELSDLSKVIGYLSLGELKSVVQRFKELYKEDRKKAEQSFGVFAERLFRLGGEFSYANDYARDSSEKYFEELWQSYLGLRVILAPQQKLSQTKLKQMKQTALTAYHHGAGMSGKFKSQPFPDQIPQDHILEFHLSSLDGNGIQSLVEQIKKQFVKEERNIILISTHKEDITEESLIFALNGLGINQDMLQALFPFGLGEYLITRDEIEKKQLIDPRIEIEPDGLYEIVLEKVRAIHGTQITEVTLDIFTDQMIFKENWKEGLKITLNFLISPTRIVPISSQMGELFKARELLALQQ